MKAGNTDAYVHLSNMYENGLYVKKDEKLAHELLMMAAMTLLVVLALLMPFFQANKLIG